MIKSFVSEKYLKLDQLNEEKWSLMILLREIRKLKFSHSIKSKIRLKYTYILRVLNPIPFFVDTSYQSTIFL